MIDKWNIRSNEAAKIIEMKWEMRIKNGIEKLGKFDVNWMISCKERKNP